MDSDDGSSMDSSSSDEELSEEVLQAKTEKARVENFQSIKSQFDKQLNKIKESQDVWQIVKAYNNPRFQDITPMFDDAAPFLVDADALMLTAMSDDNYHTGYGGQFLHLVYICERLLRIFVEKNGKFEIIFFEVWKRVYQNHWIFHAYREVLFKHFTKNTDIRVHRVEHFYDGEFNRIVSNVRPGFLLCNLGIYLDFRLICKDLHLVRKKVNRYPPELILYCAEFIHALSLDLPCVAIESIEIDASVVKSDMLEGDTRFEVLSSIAREAVQELCSSDIEIPKIVPQYYTADIRRTVVCNAAHEYLKENPHELKMLRLLLLTHAAMESFKLENRGCPTIKVKKEEFFELRKTVSSWVKLLYHILYSIDSKCDVWTTVADLWQGYLFCTICSAFSDNITDGKSLGPIANVYEEYVNMVNQCKGTIISAYPIEPFRRVCWFKIVQPHCRENKGQIKLSPVQCDLITEFCSDILKDVEWRDPSFILNKQEFDEVRHWHSRRPITDEYHHIKDTISPRPNDARALRRYMKDMYKHARFMTVYGRNLEGSINTKAIICQENKTDKPVKQKKESKKAKEIKEKIRKEKELELDKKDKETYKKLQKEFCNINDIEKLLKFQAAVNNHTNKCASVENKITFMLLEAEIYNKVCHKIMKAQGKLKSKDLHYVDSLFLLIRGILKYKGMENLKFSERVEKCLSELLSHIGLSELVKMNNLPDSTVNDTVYQEDDWIRYQLNRLGPHLERDCVGEYDDDLGFAPDPWQQELISAIRKNQSAVIVAPTSSGKTFASYYCMQRILQTSKNGIVVYVSPTKALVNQVAATVYAKFSRAQTVPGTTIVGVFTRDFRTNACNCRILVTVPQCLEILLLSPRRYTWTKNVKYVIFDEVHCLAGQAGGVSWERCLLMIRCPFLALSATIRNPEKFHKWLVDAEEFKLQRDNKLGIERSYDSKVHLVIHSERHSDLIKYTFHRDGLQHFHPYSNLDIQVINMYSGIPENIILSPLETLLLYNAIKKFYGLLQGDEVIEVFFAKNCKTGFITRNLVRDFEKKLTTVLYDIYLNQPEVYKRIINQLSPKKDIQYDEIGHSFCCDNILKLLTELHSKRMLPALIFSYDRLLVSSLGQLVSKHFYDSMVVQDRRTIKKKDKEEKLLKKQLQKDLQQTEVESKQINKRIYANRSGPKTLHLLEDTGSFLKGIGVADSDDMKFIERRLHKQYDHYKDLILDCVRQGVGIHHAGLNNNFRSSVEILFRIGLLKVVFATGTLALGIHMPCRTVVICGDSPFLNTLEYHQMSGRAGRRGFDNHGNVIFMGLNKRRQKTLMTSKLPAMLGNFPLSISLILRLMLLVSKVTDQKERTEECVKRVINSVLTLLENNLIFQDKPRLHEQMQHFFCFGLQLLHIQELISNDGNPLEMCGLVTHLHYHEPANLALAYLFRSGAIRKLIQEYKNDGDIQWALIVTMNFLFARRKLHVTQKGKIFKNSVVKLDPLPKIIRKHLMEYNKQVRFVFDEYFASTGRYYKAKYGEDNKLPLSEIKIECNVPQCGGPEATVWNHIRSLNQPRTICSTFAALSCNDDDDLYSETNTINCIRHEVSPDIKVVPLLDLDVEFNAYAADFYRHGIANAIVEDNGLKYGDHFNALKDFDLVLKTIVMAIEEMEPVDENDLVYKHFKIISDRYTDNFRLAFY